MEENKKIKKSKLGGLTIVSVNEIFFGIYILLSLLSYINNVRQMPNPSAGAGLSLLSATLFSFISVLIVIMGLLTFNLNPLGRILTLTLFPIFMFFTAAMFCEPLYKILPSKIADSLFFIYYPSTFIFTVYYLNQQHVKELFKECENKTI